MNCSCGSTCPRGTASPGFSGRFPSAHTGQVSTSQPFSTVHVPHAHPPAAPPSSAPAGSAAAAAAMHVRNAVVSWSSCSIEFM